MRDFKQLSIKTPKLLKFFASNKVVVPTYMRLSDEEKERTETTHRKESRKIKNNQGREM